MKNKEVPQDDEGLMEGKVKDLCYAVDENGRYIQVYSTGWEPKNAALKQAWEEIQIRIEKTKELVMAGSLSPVAYFMEKNIMNISILAQYVKMPKWKVRKHMKPAVFRKLHHSVLAKYAEAFNISVDQLCNLTVTEQ